MRALLFPLALAACAEFPALDARIPEAERLAPPPPLLPLTGLLAAGDALPRVAGFEAGLRAEAADLGARAAAIPAADADPDLAARAAGLAQRAGDLAEPAASDPDGERLAALRARAEALQDGVLSEEERARLEAGPSLP